MSKATTARLPIAGSKLLSDTGNLPRKAPLSLDIIVVGSGIGGLSVAYCLARAGHQITVLESAPFLGEVGAGIQLSPNSTRLLLRWGLGPALEKIAVKPEAVAFRKYDTGETTGWTQWGDRMEKEYGAPYYHIHRVDFLNMLLSLASPFMKLRLNSRVVSVDPNCQSVTIQTGETIYADLIVGADGVKSTVRETVVGRPVKPTPTGDAAYRALIPTEKMISDPDLKVLIDYPEFITWMGPERHFVGYSIRNRMEYNIVVLHPDNGVEDTVASVGKVENLRKECEGWAPIITKLLRLVDTTLHGNLKDHPPLKAWVHDYGPIVLLGDACHPMLPYRAQGSAMAVEDAAVIGNLFSHISHRSQIQPLLKAYFSLRFDRVTETSAASRLNRDIFHLKDGAEQEARDASMRKAMEYSIREAQGEFVIDDNNDLVGNANQYGDKLKSLVQYGYDADAEAETWWRQNSVMIEALSSQITTRM